MARTKASVGAKGSGDKGSRTYSGGNPVCQRETPKWQKPITNFFICKDGPADRNDSCSDDDGETAGSSKSKPKRNIIHSEDEDEPITKEGTPSDNKEDPKTKENGEHEPDVVVESEPRKNHVLDETIELEPLNGEDSHKIEEYYSKNSKGKGVGKKTKGKENLDANVERRNSLKRGLEEVTLEDNSHESKKIKVN